ncbi:MAG: histidine--tRNA ligase [Defluviitaleaceae bacterium]|nr:histidine--tRNA ligase [Defluviitaleaceae bacterium]
MAISRPKGTNDIFGTNAALWQYIEARIRHTCKLFGVGELRTPIFEYAELFKQSVGETTDIVSKEMYQFTDQGGREYVLKPEGTAAAVRAYLENKMNTQPSPVKAYYISPIFRAERPQKGRYRQHHQFGAEYFGSYHPAADAELISLAHTFLTGLGITDFTLRLNSIGDADCRKAYNTALLDYLRSHESGLCELCRERIAKNPMRVLDCKNEGCKKISADAPLPLDHISEEAMTHFTQLQSYLAALGIDFIVDKRIVRGLDYYTRTVFEFTSNNLGSQDTVCGGGRYDYLIERNGGQPTGAVGFGMGIERLLIILDEQGKLPNVDNSPQVFVGHMGSDGATKAIEIVKKLRLAGVSAITDLADRNIKSQLKYADKIGAKFSLVIGETELESGKVNLKNMQSGESIEITLDKIEENNIWKI